LMGFRWRILHRRCLGATWASAEGSCLAPGRIGKWIRSDGDFTPLWAHDDVGGRCGQLRAHSGIARAHPLDFFARGIGVRRRSCGAAVDEPLEKTRDVVADVDLFKF